MNEYQCQQCRDTGFVVTKGEDYTVYTARCLCLLKRIEIEKFQGLIEKSNMEDLQSMRFENYQPVTAKQKRALECMKGNHGSYYLFGGWGVGKTHLVAASAMEAMKKNIPSVLISVPVFLDVVRKSGREKDSDIEKLAYEIPYLILDDIGKQKDSDWTTERLFMMIDERMKKWKGGKAHTSFTSQYPLDVLETKMDGAIVSRIRGMCEVLYVDGEDYRKRFSMKK